MTTANRKPRSAKPRSGLVQLDRAHPLARGLQFAVLFDGGGPAVDKVRGFVSVPTNAPTGLAVQESGFGAGANFPAAGTAYHAFPQTATAAMDAPFTGLLTILWRGVVRVAGSFSDFAHKTQTNGGSFCPFDLRTDNGTPPKLVLVRSSSAGAGQWTSTGPTIVVGTLHNYAVTQAGDGVNTTAAFYIDAVSSGSSVTGNTNAPVGAAQAICIGRRLDGAVQMNGICSACYIWSRILPASEIAWLAFEPYAFFKPIAQLTKTPSPIIALQRRTLSPTGSHVGGRQKQIGA
jgi:hypothetical protein